MASTAKKGFSSGGLESFKGYKPKPGERIIPSGRDKGKGAENISLWEDRIDSSEIGILRDLFLGENIVKVEKGKWRNLDATRQFRVNKYDYSGVHGMGDPTVLETPHVHLEYLKPKQNGNGFKVTKNIHIPFIK